MTTYRGQDRIVTHDNLTKCTKGLGAHENRRGVERQQDNVENRVERVLKALDCTDLLSQSVDASRLFLRSSMCSQY